jgi:hypothetical protein
MFSGQGNGHFSLVGTGAVTLTGLVLVAMSLNFKEIAVDVTHRFRAINTLTGMALVFMRSALVLMGAQSHRSNGAEVFVISGLSLAVFARGYVSALRMSTGYGVLASLAGTSCTRPKWLARHRSSLGTCQVSISRRQR